MIVVSDTSPLTALLTVNESEILPQLRRGNSNGHRFLS
jgi:hypothetical protein